MELKVNSIIKVTRPGKQPSYSINLAVPGTYFPFTSCLDFGEEIGEEGDMEIFTLKANALEGLCKQTSKVEKQSMTHAEGAEMTIFSFY